MYFFPFLGNWLSLLISYFADAVHGGDGMGGRVTVQPFGVAGAWHSAENLWNWTHRYGTGSRGDPARASLGRPQKSPSDGLAFPKPG